MKRPFFTTIIVFLSAVLATFPAYAERELKFESVVLFGDNGDEAGYGIEPGKGYLFIAGTEKLSDWKAVAAGYILPPLNTPDWSLSWPADAKTSSSDIFMDASATTESIYFAGNSRLVSKQTAGLLTKFSLKEAGSKGWAALWTVHGNFFPKKREEAFRSVQVASESGAEFVYAAGNASAESNNQTAVLAKYDSNGQLKWHKLLSETKKRRKASGTALALLNEHIYVAGYKGMGGEDIPFSAIPLTPTLWKYDANGNLIWEKNADSNFVPIKELEAEADADVDLAAQDGFLYLVSGKGNQKDSSDILILKFDEKGDVVWKKQWYFKTSGGVRRSEWATGITLGQDRLFITGQILHPKKGKEKETYDIFVMEVDKEYGTILGTHEYGTSDKNEFVNAVTMANKDVYLVGKVLPTSGKNPESNLMIVRYKPLPVTEVTIDIQPTDTNNAVLLGDDKTPGPKTVTVAILAKENFKAATDIESSSLSFGRSGNEPSWQDCSMQDANKDGMLDLVCNFQVSFTAEKKTYSMFQLGDKEGILKGETKSGVRLKGVDVVKVQTGGEAPAPALAPSPAPTSATVMTQISTSPTQLTLPAPTVETTPTTTTTTSTATSTTSTSTASPSITIAATTPVTTSSSTTTVETKPIYAPILIYEPVIPGTAPAATTPPPTDIGASGTSVPPPIISTPTILSSNSSGTTSGTTPQFISYEARQEYFRRQTAARMRLSNPSSSSASPGTLTSSPSDKGDPAKRNASDTAEMARMYESSAREAMQAGNFKEAIKFYREALEHDPQSFEVHRDLALVFVKEGNIEEAKAHLSEALRLNPDDQAARQQLEKLTAANLASA